MKTFNKILIANRGEIAIRIIKAAKAMNIKTVAVYSKADEDSWHIRQADEAFCIGEQSLAETYLNVGKMIDLALKSGADAIHPGYGFLAENPELVAACEDHNIVFIGPSTKALSLMGNKIEARAFVEDLGIPMTKGVTGSPKELLKLAKGIELPILVKAAAGGGGKGMKIVRQWEDLESVIASTSREAKAYFGDAEVYVEKYVEDPRHIEIQIMGDHFGNVIHLYERECSIQRRYQKIIEESPSITLTQKVREKMGRAAVEIAQSIGYSSAGTIEFLVDERLNFYFLEMNTRIQVEHPVTEMVTGVDIVQEQIRVAQGLPLQYKQKDIKQKGHAIEARVYAEDPDNEFLPAPGFLSYYQEPIAMNVRVDSAVDKAVEIKSFFDPMISKLVVWNENRAGAIQKLKEALQDYVVLGIKTNIPFMLSLIQEEAYEKNNISTNYCDTHASQILSSSKKKNAQMNIDVIAAAYLSTKIASSPSNNIWENIGNWRSLMSFELKLGNKLRTYTIDAMNGPEFCLIKDDQEAVIKVIALDENKVVLSFDDTVHELFRSENQDEGFDFHWKGQIFNLMDPGQLKHQDFYESIHEASSNGSLKSPMPGKVIKVMVKTDQVVNKGDLLLIVEAMKMENSILAPKEGIIQEITVKAGDMVDGNKILIIMKEE